MIKPNYLERKHDLEQELDTMIVKLEELLDLQEQNYEPNKWVHTKTAIRSLLKIRGIKNLKAFHKGDQK